MEDRCKIDHFPCRPYSQCNISPDLFLGQSRFRRSQEGLAITNPVTQSLLRGQSTWVLHIFSYLHKNIHATRVVTTCGSSAGVPCLIYLEKGFFLSNACKGNFISYPSSSLEMVRTCFVHKHYLTQLLGMVF